jgi:hypothetical protein
MVKNDFLACKSVFCCMASLVLTVILMQKFISLLIFYVFKLWSVLCGPRRLEEGWFEPVISHLYHRNWPCKYLSGIYIYIHVVQNTRLTPKITLYIRERGTFVALTTVKKHGMFLRFNLEVTLVQLTSYVIFLEACLFFKVERRTYYYGKIPGFPRNSQHFSSSKWDELEMSLNVLTRKRKIVECFFRLFLFCHKLKKRLEPIMSVVISQFVGQLLIHFENIWQSVVLLFIFMKRENLQRNKKS